MGKKISLGKRYQNAFGYIARSQGNRLQSVGFKEKEGADIKSADFQVYVESDGSFEEMSIYNESFDLYFASTIGNNVANGLIFAPPPMVSFDREKTITTTPIDDGEADSSDGSVVVERYNSGQWSIKMQGLLIDMVNHRFPKYQLEMLRTMFEANEILKVDGEFFDALGIRSIYTQSISINGVQGFEDTLQFTLQAYSIKPVEYFIKNQ